MLCRHVCSQQCRAPCRGAAHASAALHAWFSESLQGETQGRPTTDQWQRLSTNPELITSGVACELILNLAAGLAAQCRSMFSISLCSSIAVASLCHRHVLLVICQYLIRQNTSTFTVAGSLRQLRGCAAVHGLMDSSSL